MKHFNMDSVIYYAHVHLYCFAYYGKELIVQLQNALMHLSLKVCQFAALYRNITYTCTVYICTCRHSNYTYPTYSVSLHNIGFGVAPVGHSSTYPAVHPFINIHPPTVYGAMGSNSSGNMAYHVHTYGLN